MILFYGWKTKRIGVEPISIHNCTYCNAHDTLFIETFGSYVHCFWIPLIPFAKSTVSFCGHCKCVLQNRQMPPDLRDKAREIAKQTRTPWYFFILPLITVFGIVSLLTAT